MKIKPLSNKKNPAFAGFFIARLFAYLAKFSAANFQFTNAQNASR